MGEGEKLMRTLVKSEHVSKLTVCIVCVPPFCILPAILPFPSLPLLVGEPWLLPGVGMFGEEEGRGMQMGKGWNSSWIIPQ